MSDRQDDVPSDLETFAEVKRWNRLRKKSGLPPIDLQNELDRVRQVREDRKFEQWMQSPLRFRVEKKMLERSRRWKNDPNWRPTGFLSGGGYAFHISLVRQMRKLRIRLGG